MSNVHIKSLEWLLTCTCQLAWLCSTEMGSVPVQMWKIASCSEVVDNQKWLVNSCWHFLGKNKESCRSGMPSNSSRVLILCWMRGNLLNHLYHLQSLHSLEDFDLMWLRHSQCVLFFFFFGTFLKCVNPYILARRTEVTSSACFWILLASKQAECANVCFLIYTWITYICCYFWIQ